MDALSQAGVDIFSTEDPAPEKTIADTSFNKSIGDLSSKFDKEIAPFRQKEIEAAGAPRQAPPKLQESGSPPSGELNPQSAAMWVAAASVLGMIAGRGGRAGTMNALAAFSGALEGLTTGNKEKFERESRAWEESNKKVLQHNQKALQEYRMALENTELDARQRSMQIQLIANKYHDEFMGEVAKHAAATGDFSTMAIVYDSKFANDKKLGDTFSKIQLAIENRRQKEADYERARQDRMTDFKEKEALKREDKTRPTLSQSAIEIFGEQMYYTGKMPQGVTARSPADRMAVMEYAAQLQKSGGKTSEEVVRQQALFQSALAGDTASLKRVASQYDAVNTFEKTEMVNMERLVAMGEKVDATGMPVFNKWINAGRKATGDADVAAFDFQYRTTVPGVARILTQPNMTGVLSDSARAEVEDAMPKALSAQQFRDVFEVVKADFYNREKKIVDQYNAIKDRLGTSKGLEPPKNESALPLTSSQQGGPPVSSGTGKWSQGDGSLQDAKRVVEGAKAKGTEPEKVRRYLRAKAQEMGIPADKMEAFIAKNVW